jgi:hypothetical protein
MSQRRLQNVTILIDVAFGSRRVNAPPTSPYTRIVDSTHLRGGAGVHKVNDLGRNDLGAPRWSGGEVRPHPLQHAHLLHARLCFARRIMEIGGRECPFRVALDYAFQVLLHAPSARL